MTARTATVANSFYPCVGQLEGHIVREGSCSRSAALHTFTYLLLLYLHLENIPGCRKRHMKSKMSQVKPSWPGNLTQTIRYMRDPDKARSQPERLT